MRAAALALPLALGACMGGGRAPALSASAPTFLPERFFAGETVGTGTLKVAMRGAVSTQVEGAGLPRPDGSLLLRQRIVQGDKDSRTRRWVIRPLGGGRYAGTLTDASGPVTGEVEGNRFHLRYPTHGVTVEQWLYLRPDGRTVDNRLVAKKLGVTVATLDEVIRKVG